MIPDEGGDPRFQPPDLPDGAGVAHPPTGGFDVKAKDLISAAHDWDDASSALGSAFELIATGSGCAWVFGLAAELLKVGTLAENFYDKAHVAAFDGQQITHLMSVGLVETANDYSGTDKTQGDNFRYYTRIADQ